MSGCRAKLQPPEKLLHCLRAGGVGLDEIKRPSPAKKGIFCLQKSLCLFCTSKHPKREDPGRCQPHEQVTFIRDKPGLPPASAQCGSREETAQKLLLPGVDCSGQYMQAFYRQAVLAALGKIKKSGHSLQAQDGGEFSWLRMHGRGSVFFAFIVDRARNDVRSACLIVLMTTPTRRTLGFRVDRIVMQNSRNSIHRPLSGIENLLFYTGREV